MGDIDDVLNDLSPTQINELNHEFNLWKEGFYKDKDELKKNVSSLITLFQFDNTSH